MLPTPQTPGDPTLTLVAEGAEEAGETLAVAADVVTGAVAVDALRTRLAATLTEETWRARCTHTHADTHRDRENVMKPIRGRRETF